MTAKYNITICSDLDFEELVADITFQGQRYGAAMITQENGVNDMEIEIIISPGEVQTIKFPLKEFLRAIEEAKKN